VPNRTHYETLNVSPSATQDEIRAAFLLLSRMFHPDRFDRSRQSQEWQKANSMTAELTAAYAVLRDPSRRAEYDRSLLDPGPSRARPGQPPGQPPRQPPPKPTASKPADADDPPKRPSRDIPTGVWFSFSSLPEHVRGRLLARQRGEVKEHFSISRSHPATGVVGIAASVALIGLLYLLSDAFRWNSDQRLLAFAVATGAATTLSWSIRWQIKFRRSDIRPATYLTPIYFVRTTFDSVRFRGLWELKAINATAASLGRFPSHLETTYTKGVRGFWSRCLGRRRDC
jgi:hypothetical protein